MNLAELRRNEMLLNTSNPPPPLPPALSHFSIPIIFTAEEERRREERRGEKKRKEKKKKHAAARQACSWMGCKGHCWVSLPLHLPTQKDNDIIVKVLYCGICHTDLCTITNEWGNARYPVVPGHEIVGVVTEVGNGVKKFKIGDKVGVGYMISSCRTCHDCNQDSENYCTKMISTFNNFYPDGTKTYGGFSDALVIHEHFVVKIPDGAPLHKFAPLLCAGVSVYTPMKHHGLNKPGMHLGVVGLGGLGHLAVLFGKAYGMRVTVISSTPDKEKEAIEQFGADALIVSRNSEQMKAAMGTMDGIINTVSAVHPLFHCLHCSRPMEK